MDEQVRLAERRFRLSGEEEARRDWVAQLVRHGLFIPPFDVMLKPGRTGYQLQAAEGKWYTIARMHPYRRYLPETWVELKAPIGNACGYWKDFRYVDDPLFTTMCVIHNRDGKKHKDPKYPPSYKNFSCTAPLPDFWLEWMADFRPTEWTDRHENELTKWYLRGGAIYNPGAP